MRLQIIILKIMNRKSILEASGEQDPARVYKVDLSNLNIKEISLLKEFQKMRCLVLSYNLITKLENLQCFPDLRELHLESNCLDKLAGLESNKALQVLNLRSNRIEKIQNIGHLIKLETLILNHNCISKVSGLEYLKDLKHLYISHNSIESLQNLPAFSKLQYLNFSHNKIKYVPNGLFISSKGLTFLDLSHNRIEGTSFLQQLTSLQTLNLSHNRIKELSTTTMPNLQSLNLSHNEIEQLPPIGVTFPEIITLDISYNMICSEFQILTALAETEFLTQFDFRNNPMFTQQFQQGLQKIHSFDFLNGRAITKAGAKYYQKIEKIQEELVSNRQIYGEDDQRDRQIKMSGFYDEELEFQMTGMKAARPTSPSKKKKNLEKPTFYEDIDRIYHEFSQNDLRIKVLREQYLKICGQYDIKGSQHILTELPAESAEFVRTNIEEKGKEEQLRGDLGHKFENSEQQIRKQNQKNLNKWKELKQREKSFNIREVIRKSRGKDNSVVRGSNSTISSNWNGSTGFKAEKMKSELLKTQAVPRKVGEQLFKTMVRPRSVHKKQ